MAGFTSRSTQTISYVGSAVDGSMPDIGVRWAVAPDRRIIKSTLEDRSPAKPEKPLAEAQVVWGGPANFDYGASEDFSVGPIVHFNQSNDDDATDDPLKPIVRQYTEVARQEKTVRVTGPNGAYLDVAVITELLLKAPNDPDTGVEVYEQYTFRDPDDIPSPTGSA
jgi:hypothetical protein